MEEKKGLGIAALVLAILGLLGCWIPFLNVLSIGLFFIAIILGIIAIVKKHGKVLAIVGIVLAIVGWFIAAKINGAVVDVASEFVKSYSGDIEQASSGEIADAFSSWLTGTISEGVDELNSQIEAGVSEFSEGVNEFNEALSGDVAEIGEGVDTVNEGLSEIGSAIVGE